MALILGKAPAVKKTFKAPGHVAALGFLAIICLIAGVVLMITGDLVTGLVSLFQCCALLILQAVAEDAAYARWKIDVIAQDLEVVISEATAQSNQRILARQKQEIEEADRLRREREAADTEDE